MYLSTACTVLWICSISLHNSAVLQLQTQKNFIFMMISLFYLCQTLGPTQFRTRQESDTTILQIYIYTKIMFITNGEEMYKRKVKVTLQKSNNFVFLLYKDNPKIIGTLLAVLWLHLSTCRYNYHRIQWYYYFQHFTLYYIEKFYTSFRILF